MRLALESACALGISMPIVSVLYSVYDQCWQNGPGEEDFSATINLLEQHVGVEVQSRLNKTA
jgi:3-hydroxyisobutyrate dehydrogenase-like beta-hydroxyacid dehydrogenase